MMIHRPDASYSRWTVDTVPGVRARWVTRSDPENSRPVSEFSVAKLAPTIVVSIHGTKDVTTTLRRAGQVAPAVGATTQLGLEFEPWMNAAIDDIAEILTEGVGREGPDAWHDRVGLLRLLPNLTPARPTPASVALVNTIERLPVGLTVSQLGTHLGWSERSLRRHVLTSTGLTPNKILRLNRAQLARNLLAAGQTPAAAAAQCGLADQSHLNREFARWCGYSPAAWARHAAAWTDSRARSQPRRLAE